MDSLNEIIVGLCSMHYTVMFGGDSADVIYYDVWSGRY